MKRILAGAIALVIGAATWGAAQSLEDLNIQIHGYATQGLLYSTQNNVFTAATSDGSPSWSDVVVNVTAEPLPKLRVAFQARYFLLGTQGNALTLDWASADYKVNDRFGVRFGKVKTPSTMFNEIQDVDPGYLWSLLPQSVYPILSRNTVLTNYGGVVYGTVAPIKELGKFEYRAWGGESIIASTDGFFIPIIDAGTDYPNGLSGPTYGGALHWLTPVHGLMFGASITHDDQTGPVTIPVQGFSGNTLPNPFVIPDFYGKYEHKRFMFASEYERVVVTHEAVFTVGPPGVHSSYLDHRNSYAMASYKVTDKLTVGMYYSNYIDRKAAIGPGNYQKDWVVSGRYDFNQYLYAKAEQHFVDGEGIVYDTRDNRSGLKPQTRLTALKVGVSF
ncbi:MAG: hypothetical protein ABSD76_11770 [Terriglobales bacterium]|jgi:hypothetical protein